MNPPRRYTELGASLFIIHGAGAVSNQPPFNDSETIELPDWVKARLRQDNRNLSQAIVDMVIWVDRVKCWMYQADADLAKVLDEMSIR